MAVAFWSIALKSKDKPVDVQPPDGYVLNVQQIALADCKNDNESNSMVVKIKTVSVEGEDLNSVLATLRPRKVEQVPLNLVFGYDVPVTFYVSGDAKGTVYLSG